ncbi:MAG TPA: GIY-YIG nuclease family protein [Gammaproteobacteria bacterium]|jgi:putative endonuclease
MTATGETPWHVYIVRCADASLYTGIAKDLHARIDEHNDGGGAKYTRTRLPVELVYTEEASDRSAAQRREAAIKQLSTRKKHELIARAR